MRRTLTRILLPALVLLRASNPVVAEDRLGIYAGAAIGESHLRATTEITGDTGYDHQFDERHSAWKLSAGVRPITPLAVELDYMDLGNPRSDDPLGFGGLSQVNAKAWTLFALGYIPLNAPSFDVYGKLGLARLQTTVTEISPIPECPAGYGPCSRSAFTMSDNRTTLAYGAGATRTFGALALRAEYERFGAIGGNPDLFAVGVTWTF